MRRVLTLVAATAALTTASCGEREPDVWSPPGRTASGVLTSPIEILLRHPDLPLFVGGGTPTPAEPIQGLDDALAQVFPEQVRGSAHPWTTYLVEVVSPVRGRFAVLVEEVGTWRPGVGPKTPASVAEVPFEAGPDARTVVAVALRASDRSDAPSSRGALRWAVVHTACDGDTCRVSTTETETRELTEPTLPADAGTAILLDFAAGPVSGFRAIPRPAKEPRLLAAFAWWRTPSGRGLVWNHTSGFLDFTMDGVPYKPTDWPRPLWQLSLAAR
jgi:hypothetical protein